jgi:hypothetical protein
MLQTVSEFTSCLVLFSFSHVKSRLVCVDRARAGDELARNGRAQIRQLNDLFELHTTHAVFRLGLHEPELFSVFARLPLSEAADTIFAFPVDKHVALAFQDLAHTVPAEPCTADVACACLGFLSSGLVSHFLCDEMLRGAVVVRECLAVVVVVVDWLAGWLAGCWLAVNFPCSLI